MVEDMSAYMRLSITVWMTAAFLSAIVNILSMGIGILYGYSDKYTTNLATGYLSNLIAMSQEEKVNAPICFSAIDAAIDNIDSVYMCEDRTGDGDFNDSGEIIATLYKYDNSSNTLIKLITEYKVHETKVIINPSTRSVGLYNVYIEVLD